MRHRWLKGWGVKNKIPYCSSMFTVCCVGEEDVTVKIYCLISTWSSLKTLSSDFTYHPLVTGPAHLCAISTPRRAYRRAVISAHWTYRRHCHPCPTRYAFSPESSEAFEGVVPSTRTQHRNNVPKMSGHKWYISLKILHNRQRHRRSATL